jgi:hypothetical protein
MEIPKSVKCVGENNIWRDLWNREVIFQSGKQIKQHPGKDYNNMWQPRRLIQLSIQCQMILLILDS